MVSNIYIHTWMLDRDIDEIFLNFELDSWVQQYAGVDVGALEFQPVGVASCWLAWNCLLKCFKPLLYGTIKM